MPIYEFACSNCDHRFEDLVKAGDSLPAPACPACDSPDTVRLLSSFSVRSGPRPEAAALARALSGPGAGGCCGGACGGH